MNRITSFLALSAIVVAGAFAGTAAQASASNVVLDFKVHNGDASASMIRSSTLPGTISSMTSPAAAVARGGDDPSSGYAVFSAPYPSIGGYAQGSVTYVNAGDLSSNACTFNIRITRLGSQSFKAHFWVTESGTNCTVPGDATNTDGQFTSTVYTFVWST
ncbi:MAG: hypothetical protein M3169_13740 [Candidatus Eremiobacteraeota bacterium]|nr:hypothetical protein [Candidatus Eremiobacteraeota bacterium]